jgi:hypothetical protein
VPIVLYLPHLRGDSCTAPVQLETQDGSTPLAYAVRNGHAAVEAAIRRHSTAGVLDVD